MKPNALSTLEWIVGFRYIYLQERFMAHGGSRYNWGLFSLLPLNPTYGHIPIFIIKFTLTTYCSSGISKTPILISVTCVSASYVLR